MSFQGSLWYLLIIFESILVSKHSFDSLQYLILILKLYYVFMNFRIICAFYELFNNCMDSIIIYNDFHKYIVSLNQNWDRE